jgi:hypothetical protein
MKTITNKFGFKASDLWCILLYWVAALLPFILEIYFKH